MVENNSRNLSISINTNKSKIQQRCFLGKGLNLVNSEMYLNVLAVSIQCILMYNNYIYVFKHNLWHFSSAFLSLNQIQ